MITCPLYVFSVLDLFNSRFSNLAFLVTAFNNNKNNKNIVLFRHSSYIANFTLCLQLFPFKQVKTFRRGNQQQFSQNLSALNFSITTKESAARKTSANNAKRRHRQFNARSTIRFFNNNSLDIIKIDA